MKFEPIPSTSFKVIDNGRKIGEVHNGVFKGEANSHQLYEIADFTNKDSGFTKDSAGRPLTCSDWVIVPKYSQNPCPIMKMEIDLEGNCHIWVQYSQGRNVHISGTNSVWEAKIFKVRNPHE